MTDQKQNRTLAKIIAYMLGKAPEEFGLIPDADGFVKTKELLQALHDEDGWRHVRAATLNELAITLPDVPFEIRDNSIRSRQRTAPAEPVITRTPPRCLYTCIRQKAYPHILQKGIFPSSHNRVVLYTDRALADKIGRRKTADPVTLTVQTEKAGDQGVLFYHAGEKLYFADYVPADCFSGPALPKDREKKPAKNRIKPPAELPAEGTHNRAGAFLINPPPKAGSDNGRDKKGGKETEWKRERKKRDRQDRKQWPDQSR